MNGDHLKSKLYNQSNIYFPKGVALWKNRNIHAPWNSQRGGRSGLQKHSFLFITKGWSRGRRNQRKKRGHPHRVPGSDKQGTGKVAWATTDYCQNNFPHTYIRFESGPCHSDVNGASDLHNISHVSNQPIAQPGRASGQEKGEI